MQIICAYSNLLKAPNKPRKTLIGYTKIWRTNMLTR